MLTRILLSLPLWLAYTAAALALDVIGLVILLPLSATHAWKSRQSKVYGREFRKPTMLMAWRGGWLTWLWGNEEDGVTGPIWWGLQNAGKPLWLVAYRWSALRNASNNMRFIPVINPVIDPERIRWSMGGGHSWEVIYTWQGIYSGIHVTFPARGTFYSLWLGWKLKPSDAVGVADTDMRKPRCGFALQLKRIG